MKTVILGRVELTKQSAEAKKSAPEGTPAVQWHAWDSEALAKHDVEPPKTLCKQALQPQPTGKPRPVTESVCPTCEQLFPALVGEDGAAITHLEHDA